MSRKISLVIIVLALSVVYLIGGVIPEFPEHDFIIRSVGYFISVVIILLSLIQFKVKT